MSAKLQKLREELNTLNSRYKEFREKHGTGDDKKVNLRDLKPEVRADFEDLHGRIRDVSMEIDFEESQSLSARHNAEAEAEVRAQAARNMAPVEGGDARDRSRMTPQERAFEMGLRGASINEVRGQAADILGEGGFLLAPRMFVDQILRNVDDDLIIPTLATVFTGVGPEGMGVIREAAQLDEPSWGTETSEAPESDVQFGTKNLTPKEHKLLVKVTEKLLGYSTVDIVGYIQGRLAYKYGVAAEKSFMTGTGNNQPLGLFTASDDGISTGRDVDTASTGTITGDDFIEAIHSVKSSYMRNGVWVLNRTVLKAIRKLKDGNGNYIWQPDGQVGRSVVGGNPATLLDRPYIVSEFAPNATSSGSYAALFGDMSYYWIARGDGLRIKLLQELYAATDQVGYRAVASLDAAPQLEEAFVRLKVKS